MIFLQYVHEIHQFFKYTSSRHLAYAVQFPLVCVAVNIVTLSHVHVAKVAKFHEKVNSDRSQAIALLIFIQASAARLVWKLWDSVQK